MIRAIREYRILNVNPRGVFVYLRSNLKDMDNGGGQGSFVNAASFSRPQEVLFYTAYFNSELRHFPLYYYPKFISLSLGSPDIDMC